MFEVYFQSTKEVTYFCESLFQITNEINVHWETNKDWGNRLQLNNSSKQLAISISKAMVDVFMNFHLTEVVRKLIKDKYYYTDQEEINRILNLTEEMLLEEHHDFNILDKEYPKDMLQTLFYTNIRQTPSIHFDSIIQFRLSAFRDELIQWIGLAIDDFKREEDHQAFIHMLREYISNKQASHDLIHVLQGDSFTFYKTDGSHLTEKKLKQLMHKEPLYIVGLDGNEMNLAPLIAIAPNTIKIYGDDPSEPKTQTIINVFQEKVKFLPVSDFPFSLQR